MSYLVVQFERNQMEKVLPNICCLILNRGDLLTRLFNSIDMPVEEFFLIYNHTGTPDPSIQTAIDDMEYKILQKQTPVRHLTVYRPEGPLTNTGVARGWNICVKENKNAKYWTIVGNDIMFSPGDLEKMHDAAEEHHLTHAMFWANHGFSFFIITPLAIEKVGWFDINFYPAYKEDQCFGYRMSVVGVPRMNVQEIKSIHGDIGPNSSRGSSTIYSSPEYMAKNARTHHLNYLYYVKKYGGDAGHELWVHPYNDETKDIKYFEKPKEICIW
jgi:hypothetical protein